MWKYILVFLTLSSVAIGQDGYEIKGHVDLDDSWNRVIYLSLIEAFDELTTISGEMIIGQANISDDGEYSFKGNYLPLGDRIYRVHICKKGDPISTIIIGGREHNHVHFAMSPGDLITLNSKPGQIFHEVDVTGNPVNEFLVATKEILDRDRSSSIKSTLSVRLKGEETANELLALIDRCSYPLGKFYAAYYLLDRFDHTSAIDQIGGYIHAGSWAESPYYEEVVELLEYKVPESKDDRSGTNSRMMGLILVIPVAFGMGWWLISKNNPSAGHDPLGSLSVQERKVLALLTDGLSNKEISSELSIGVSTVKSHVHNIYKKLQIKSRKDVYRFRNDLSRSDDLSNKITTVNSAS